MKNMVYSLVLVAILLLSGCASLFSIDDGLVVMEDPFKIILHSRLERCEDSREDKQDNGYECIGGCVIITEDIIECPSTRDRMDEGDIGKYVYFTKDSYSCSDVKNGKSSGPKDQAQWECIYEYGEGDCNDECQFGKTECVGDRIKRCVRDYDSDSCAEWGDVYNCPEDQICNPSDNKCGLPDKPLFDCGNGVCDEGEKDGSCPVDCPDILPEPNPLNNLWLWITGGTGLMIIGGILLLVLIVLTIMYFKSG